MNNPRTATIYCNTTVDDPQTKLHYLEVRVHQLEQALEGFIQRVDNGEIRSSETYKKFKALLAG